EPRDIQDVLRWIETNRCATFRATDLQYLRCFRGDPRRRDKALALMEKRHHVRRVGDIELRGAKNPAAAYEVNPGLRTWEGSAPRAPPPADPDLAALPAVAAGCRADCQAPTVGGLCATPSEGQGCTDRAAEEAGDRCQNCQSCQPRAVI